MLGNGLHRPGPPRGSGAATCLTPLGLPIRSGLGGPELPFPPGGGPMPPRATLSCQGGGRRAGPATCPWQKALRGTPAQLLH
jgi:hypothetical protein